MWTSEAVTYLRERVASGFGQPDRRASRHNPQRRPRQGPPAEPRQDVELELERRRWAVELLAERRSQPAAVAAVRHRPAVCPGVASGAVPRGHRLPLAVSWRFVLRRPAGRGAAVLRGTRSARSCRRSLTQQAPIEVGSARAPIDPAGTFDVEITTATDRLSGATGKWQGIAKKLHPFPYGVLPLRPR